MDFSRDQKNKVVRKGKSRLNKSFKTCSALSTCLEDAKLTWKKKIRLAGIWDEWPKLAGLELSKHCQPLNLRQGILTIGASHPQWRQALQYNRHQLLASLRSAGHEIRDLRIQQHYPSKKEKIESEQSIWEKHPSRIDIHGTSNCKSCGSPAPEGEISLWGICCFCRRKNLSEYSNQR